MTLVDSSLELFGTFLAIEGAFFTVISTKTIEKINYAIEEAKRVVDGCDDKKLNTNQIKWNNSKLEKFKQRLTTFLEYTKKYTGFIMTINMFILLFLIVMYNGDWEVSPVLKKSQHYFTYFMVINILVKMLGYGIINYPVIYWKLRGFKKTIKIVKNLLSEDFEITPIQEDKI